MPITKSTAALLAGAVAVLIALAGCASPGAGPASTASATPISGGTYTHAFSFPGVITSLDPPTLIFHEALQVVRGLTDSLVDQNPKTGEIVPWIATKWTVSDDAKTYTFTLRDGSTFADGTPIDAAAVKANFDRIQALGPKAIGAAPLLIGFTGTTVVNAKTVKFEFSQPSARFLQALTGAVFGLISPKDLAKAPTELAKGNYAGSGPFTLKSYNPQSEIDLDKRVGYNSASSLAKHTGDAYIDHLVFIEEGTPAKRADQVLSGEIQSASQIAYQDEARLTAGGATLLPLKIPGLTENLIINQKSFLGSEPKVRQALLAAIDTRTITKTVFGASYGAGTSPLGSNTPGYSDQSALIKYNPKKAKSLLDEAGWVPAADGIREKDGKKLTIRVPGIGAWGASNGDAAVLLQAELKEVGIDLPLDKSDPATQQALLASGSYEADKWQMTRADPSVLYAVWSSTHTSQGYALAQPGPLDDLLAKQESEIDPKDRAAASAKVQEYLIKNAWSIPLDDRAWTYAYNSTAHGLRADAETKLVFYDVWVDAK
ncbi:MAG: peptide transporter, permease component [Microbacteriaceae bacterium]|nr:peptide transporter, permease component [Microbacteriaceae bacterium]